MLGRVYSKIIMSNSLVNRVEKDFYDYEQNIPFLIMGDSHSQAALNPDVIGTAFNFSSAGENYMQSYYKLKHILEHQSKNIETILLPIDLHSFSSFRSTGDLTHYYWVQYIDYIELGLVSGDLFLCLLQAMIAKLFPYAGQVEFILRFLCDDLPHTTMLKGYVPNEGDLSKREHRSREAKKRAEYHFKNARYMDKVLFHYFQKTIDLCSTYKIKVVLVKFPVSSEYYYYASQLISIESIYEKINAEIDNKPDVRVMDYQKEFFGKDYLFCNADHLNPLGAEKLSESIIARMRDSVPAEES